MERLNPQKFELEAMWDTGATGSIITQKVVEACGLKPTRTSFLQGVHGIEKTEAYSVDIYLPSAIMFHKVHVVKGNYCNGGWEVIIGMDLIAIGEFSVRNVGSNTEFSFSFHSNLGIPKRQARER